MRGRILWVAASACAGFALAAACGGDDSNGGGPTNDASTNDVTTSDGAQPRDSGGSDSGGSDAGGDAGPGTATVRVLSYGGGRNPTDEGPGLAGTVAVFADSSGTPTATMTTGTDGRATAVVTAGSSVTVVVQHGTSVDIVSIAGVEPGDDLVAYSQATVYTPKPNGSSMFAYPAGDAGSGGGSPYYSEGCGYGSGIVGASATLATDPSCVVGGHTNALAWNGDLTTAVPSYASKANVPVDADGGATIDGWSWSPATQVPFGMTGALPADASRVYTSFLFRGGGLTYAWFLGNNQATDGGTIAPFTVGVPSPAVSFLDNVVATSSVQHADDDAGDYTYSTVTDIENVADASFSIDYGSLPPRLHNPTFVYDAATRTVTGTIGIDGAGTSLVGLTVYGYTSFSPADGGAAIDISWTLVAPFAASFTSPPLPAVLATQLAVPNGPMGVGLAIAQGGSALPDYATYKPRYERYQTNYQMDPTRGRVLTSEVGQN